MRYTILALAALALAAPLAAGTTGDESAPADANVNSRYTIESVSLTGYKDSAISPPLRTEIDGMVGEKLDHPRLEKLAARMKKELHVADVSVNVSKGNTPDHVVVEFAVTRVREQKLDLNVSKFLYDSKQGWSGQGSATAHIGGNAFTFGLVSDGDSLPERFAGFRAAFNRSSVGTDRLGLSFEFDSYHEQWNRATLFAAEPSDIYRTLQIFTPTARVILAEPLELDLGVRFARYRLSTPGASTESSNAVVSTLRYHQRWGSAADAQQQEVEASYALDSATHVFNSDPAYTRHTARARYRLRRGRNIVELEFLAGQIRGRAPLFDRFVLGNATALRGWNKFDLDPLGGSHVAYGSLGYVYRFFQVFYDTGAVWDRTQDREQKQSLGVGFKKEGFQLAVAFPVRAGHADPVFLAGMNF